MATTNALQGQPEQNEVRVDLPAFRQESECIRCGGLMVGDFCTDLLSGKGGLDCPTRRCVQCGDVVDPVIRWNRHLQHHLQQLAGTGREITVSNQAVH